MGKYQSYGRPRNPVGRILIPLLIYWGIEIVIQILTATAYITVHMNDLLKVYENEAMFQEFMQDAYKFLFRFSTEMTAAGALIMLPVCIYMIRKDERERQLFISGKRAGKAAAGKYTLLAGLGITAGIAVNNLLILSNLRLISQNYQSTSAALYSAPLAVQLAGLGIIVPVLEELLYRGVLYQRMKDMVAGKKAVVFSALLFGLVHGNLVQLVYAFLFGLLLCYVYDRYGSLKAPVILHCTANLVSVVMTETDGYKWIFQTPLRMGIITVACACLASVCFVAVKGMRVPEEQGENREQK